MTIKDFINQNKQQIDEVILSLCPNNPRINNEERKQWIMSDEGLYRWARSEGVRV